MFWKFNLLTTSHIDTLLDKEDVTLHELMDEDDILQECKAQNRKLINFLVLPENMCEMVKLITEEPTEDMDEKIKYKYPNTACELLTSDVAQVNDTLAGNDVLIHKLYNFLETDKTLNPLLASFFSKVMGLLITRKSEMILEYLKGKEDFVGTLLRHIGTSAIMDLLLRLLTCIESPEIRRAMVEWLNEQMIVKKLVNSITIAFDEDIHCNAAQSLCDIIRLGREQLVQLNSQDRSDADPLLTSVEMEETVAELLDNMLATDRNESVIVNGLSVIQTLLEFKKQGPEDSIEMVSAVDAESIFHGVNNVLTAICPRLKDFHTILLEPPKQRLNCMPSTTGILDPPLGNTRLQTARLISTLILANRHSINVELAQLGTIGVLLDLYFRYVWNNFLHSHVTQCVYTILNNSPTEVEGQKEHPLLTQLFTEVQLFQKILEQWEKNDQEQSQEGGRRRGFMGHLTQMTNNIVSVDEKGENSELVKKYISELSEETKEKWEAFLIGSLLEVNKKNTVEMVRGHPLASSSEDDDADFRDIPFPQDTAMQQAFSDYQLQQMTSNFIDQFGFNEEEFGEQEEKTDSPFTDRISSIDFGVSVNSDDTRQNASMFEQTCNERIQQFDEDSDEDIWEEKEITFSQNTKTKRSERLPVATHSQGSDDSTDSEEELDSPKKIVQLPPPGEKMDIDTSEGWANFQEGATEGGPVAMDTSPWDSSSKETTEKWAEFTNKIPEHEEDENWADFTSFSDLDRKENPPRSSSPVAMDTTEPASRTKAYLTENKEAALTIESIDSTEDSTEISTTTTATETGATSQEADSTTDTAMEKEPTSQAVVPDTTTTATTATTTATKTTTEVPATTTTSQGSTEATENISQSSTTSSPQEEVTSQSSAPQESEKPDSSTDKLDESVDSDKPPTPPSNPPPDDDDLDIPLTPRSPPAKPSEPESTTVNVSLQQPADPLVDTQGKGDGFLQKAGLMKSAVSNCRPTVDSALAEDSIQGNGPTNENANASTEADPSNSKLEDLRAQAKEALDSFDTAKSTGASVKNGPV